VVSWINPGRGPDITKEKKRELPGKLGKKARKIRYPGQWLGKMNPLNKSAWFPLIK